MISIKELIRNEVDRRRQNLVYELMGHEEDFAYHRIKGMHDAYVDMLTYIDNSVPEKDPVTDCHKLGPMNVKEAMKESVPVSSSLATREEQKPIKVLYIPKFRTGDLVRSSKNPRLTYKILGVGSMNELGNPEYEVEIFTDGKPDEPRNLKHIEIEKMDSWGELVEQKPAEWSEEDEKIMQTMIKDGDLKPSHY